MPATVTDSLTLLRPEDVCERLRISRDTFYRLVRDGRLRTVRLGGPGSALRVRVDELRRFVENQEEGR